MSLKGDMKKGKVEVSSKSKGKVGEWVRHMSSSGKEYYYNVNTHASQWEKPREWLDYEKKYGPVPSTPSAPKAPPSSSSSSTTSNYQQASHHHHQQILQQQHQQQQQQQQIQERERTDQRDRYNSGAGNYPSTSSTATSSYHSHATSSGSHSSSHHHNSHSHTHHVPHGGFHTPQQQQQAGQQIVQVQQRHSSHYDSYSDRYHGSYAHGSHTVTSSGSTSSLRSIESTPSSSRTIILGVRDHRKPSEDHNSEDMDISPAENSISPGSGDSKTIGSTSQQHDHHRNGIRDRDRDRDRDRERDRDRDRDRDSRRDRDRDGGSRREERGRAREREPRSLDHERSRSHLRDDRSQSPWDKDGTPERQDAGEPSGGVAGAGMNSMGRLGSLGSESEMSALAPLPPSLAVYYREDLIQHVKSLTGDPSDRQASRLGEEFMTTSAMQLSKVSTELKMARSLVRLTDIQATLQEQRILFLREQIRNLEESDKDNSAMLGVETAE